MLPSFPDFTPLQWTDRQHIEELTNRFAPYSEFNVINMWCWHEKYRAVSQCSGNVVQMIYDAATGEHALSFLGRQAIPETARLLLDVSERLRCSARLRLIPEEVIAADPRMRTHFRLHEEVHDHDHLLSIPEWVVTPGSRYRTARNHISAFQHRYRSEFRRLALADGETQHAIEGLFQRWAEQKDALDASATGEELSAIRRLFSIADAATLIGFGLYVDEDLVGFLICEARPSGYAIAHYWKGDRRYRGVYCYLLHRTCQDLQAAGFSLLNIGQDLGLPGLASAKRSFQPCSHLRKYAVTVA